MTDDTKVCTKCECVKEVGYFSTRKKSRDGLSSWCRDCFRDYWKAKYYERHEHYRHSHNASRNKIRDQNARKVFEFLKSHPCAGCGESDPVVLEFDHRDKNDKIENVSNLIKNSTWKKIKFEIEKCDVLCANCHRRRSAAQFGYKRHVFLNT